MLIAPEEPGEQTLRVPVLKVFDGDGFLTRVWNERRQARLELVVRFGFTDAPELAQPGGEEAKDFLSSLISDRWLELVVLVKMDTGGVVDRHGRLVCVPYLREVPPSAISRNIELEMVLNGWSWVLDRYEPDERYFEALEDAQRHRRGIWAFDDNVHPWTFKQQKYRQRQRKATNAQPTLLPEPEAGSPCLQPGCGGRLLKRSGRFGAFLGCSNYPTCRYSRSA